MCFLRYQQRQKKQIIDLIFLHDIIIRCLGGSRGGCGPGGWDGAVLTVGNVPHPFRRVFNFFQGTNSWLKKQTLTFTFVGWKKNILVLKKKKKLKHMFPTWPLIFEKNKVFLVVNDWF